MIDVHVEEGESWWERGKLIRREEGGRIEESRFLNRVDATANVDAL